MLNMVTTGSNFSGMENTTGILNASTTTAPPSVLDGKIAIVLISIAAPILFIVGMIGNILIIVVIRRGVLPSIATTLSFTYLAAADVVVLVFGLTDLWLYSYSIYIKDFDETWCAIHMWLIYASISLSSWALVFITIQRTISIYFPLKNVTIATKSNTLIGLIVMTILICGINLHILWTAGFTSGLPAAETSQENTTTAIDNSSTSSPTMPPATTSTQPLVTNTSFVMSTSAAPSAPVLYCDFRPEHEEFFYGIWTWVDFSMACVVPTALLIIGNLLIICRLTAATRKRQEMSQNKDDSSKIHTLSVMLLCITLLFFVCTIPIVVLEIGHKEWFDLNDPSDAAIYLLVRIVANLLQYTNNTANFILYCLTSNVFRKKLTEIVCGRKKKPKDTSMITSVTGGSTMATVVTKATAISKANMNGNENGSTKNHENTAL